MVNGTYEFKKLTITQLYFVTALHYKKTFSNMTIIGERNTFDDQTLLGGLLSSTDDDRDLSKSSGQSDSLFKLSPLPLNSLSSHNI